MFLFIGGEMGDWCVHRISFGGDRKVRRCLSQISAFTLDHWQSQCEEGKVPYIPSVVSHTAKPAAPGHCTLLLNQKEELLMPGLLGLLLNSTRKSVFLSPTWIDSLTFSNTLVDTEM